MTSIDVTIRGAGIFGLSIAFACQARGARVQVVDPHGPGAGASGGIVGALAPHVPENWNPKKAFQLESLLMAERFWDDVAQTGGKTPGYGRTGRLQPLADAHAVELARSRAEGARSLWQGRADWRVIPVSDAGPFAPPSPTGLLIHDTLSARLHPAQACGALVAAITARGGRVVTEAPDRGAVVHATGWRGLLRLSEDYGRKIGDGVKGQAVLFAHAAPDSPQLFVDGLHLVPHADGTLAVGSTSERVFDSPDATDAQCETLIARALAALPALDTAPVLRRWAGVRPRARSRAPLLGALPGHPGHFVANGGFKIGFGMAPGIAEAMARLILDGENTIPTDFLFESLA
ncbi:FAD-binding oxidoreductase [Cognatishimia sp. F0-27]|uniref:NAD(P)/FAD-dependent oxidoreductase n=1 Tax=Cognatishimia sp. F0-27 TaxID=2816855 RepID=UPI001D0BF6AF|nr:FAD-dependent oxidoreductase [Cognatishimia sp. F0-27]MCC1492194.1 FAD-binding oxidoreductase [Cognatishimia sp. F0-27]